MYVIKNAFKKKKKKTWWKDSVSSEGLMLLFCAICTPKQRNKDQKKTFYQMSKQLYMVQNSYIY